MVTEIVQAGASPMALVRVTGDASPDAPELIWAHGWGQTHQAMLPLAQAMRRIANSAVLDLPGFGASPMPPAVWGTEDYADAAADWLAASPPGKRIWIGHSFGCRVGLQLAARHPDAIDGLFLIAAAGLQRRRTVPQRIRHAGRRWAYRIARQVTPEGPARDKLRARFGSSDYQLAGAMRPILVKAVSEDLTDVAAKVRCPTVLAFGEQDRDTPPEFGERFNRLIPGSRLIVLRGFDHLNILTDGRHQITQRLTEFVEQFT